jgi:hypothetical protein
MRELNVVGLDVDSKRIICEADGSGEKFLLRSDDRLRAAVRGDRPVSSQPKSDTEVQNVLSPKEIQAKIRAGASVEQVASAAGVDVGRVERFAHPVLLERSRAAELATAAHPVLADGPSVLTLLETVTSALVARGLDPEATNWDAWRNEDGRQRRPLPVHAGRAWRHRDRVRRRGMRADRSRLRPAAAAAGAGCATRLRRAGARNRRTGAACAETAGPQG